MSLIRHSICEVEYPVHNPDYQKFKMNYDPDAELLILQIHPNSWDDLCFEEFYQVVDYLLSENITFIRPYEYFKLLNDVAEEILF